jgi:hypothetical protein
MTSLAPKFARRTLAGALACGLALALAACGTEPSSMPQDTGPAPLLEETIDGTAGTLLDRTLLSCSPLPAAADSAVVGPEGGTLVAGPHRLQIPAGAVAEPTTISMSVVRSGVNAVELAPHGLVFPRDARPTLSLGYANCDRSILLSKRVVYTDGTFRLLELLPSLDLRSDSRVSAPLDHFSRYAVSY